MNISERFLLLNPDLRQWYVDRKELYDLLGWSYDELFIDNILNVNNIGKNIYHFTYDYNDHTNKVMYLPILEKSIFNTTVNITYNTDNYYVKYTNINDDCLILTDEYYNISLHISEYFCRFTSSSILKLINYKWLYDKTYDYRYYTDDILLSLYKIDFAFTEKELTIIHNWILSKTNYKVIFDTSYDLYN